MPNSIKTTTLDRRRKCFHLADGTTLEFSAMLDGDCNVTDDASAAVIAIYQVSDGRYKGPDLRLFKDTDGNAPMAYLDCDVKVIAVNVRGKFFRLDDGTTLPFVAGLDIDLQPTNNADAIVVAIAQLSDGLFRGVDLRLFKDTDMIEVLQ